MLLLISAWPRVQTSTLIAEGRVRAWRTDGAQTCTRPFHIIRHKKLYFQPSPPPPSSLLEISYLNSTSRFVRYTRRQGSPFPSGILVASRQARFSGPASDMNRCHRSLLLILSRVPFAIPPQTLKKKENNWNKSKKFLCRVRLCAAYDYLFTQKN